MAFSFMHLRDVAVSTLSFLIFVSAPTIPAHAQWFLKDCIEQSPQPAQMDPTTTLIAEIVTRVAVSIGLGHPNVTIKACDFSEKVFSYVTTGSDGITAGRYIVYNPTWLREVVGDNQVEMVALFGHEMGHILNDHFISQKDLSPVEKETEADHFAGCAVARLGGGKGDLDALIKRIRATTSQLYPDRLHALQTADEGYEGCGGFDQKVAADASKCMQDRFCGIDSHRAAPASSSTVIENSVITGGSISNSTVINGASK